MKMHGNFLSSWQCVKALGLSTLKPMGGFEEDWKFRGLGLCSQLCYRYFALVSMFF